MREYFLTIEFIFLAVLLLFLYYFVKEKVIKDKRHKQAKLISRKMYQDSRSLIQSRIRHLLTDLESGKIIWLMVSANHDKSISMEITYNSMSREIEIRDRSSSCNDSQVKSLKQMGAIDYHSDGMINITRSSPNSKIISDIIFFIIEDVYQYKSAFNLKVSTSGVY